MTNNKTIQQTSTHNTTETGIAEQMLALWESKIPGNPPLTLTAGREVILKVLFKAVFRSELSRWSDFIDTVHCEQDCIRMICSWSDLPYYKRVMKLPESAVFFDWVITPQNCLNVINGCHLDLPPKLLRVKNLITRTALSRILTNEMVHQMLEIWTQKLSSDRPLQLTKIDKSSLKLVFEMLFHSDLDLWVEHVDSIVAKSNKVSDNNVLFYQTFDELKVQAIHLEDVDRRSGSLRYFYPR